MAHPSRPEKLERQTPRDIGRKGENPQKRVACGADVGQREYGAENVVAVSETIEVEESQTGTTGVELQGMGRGPVEIVRLLVRNPDMRAGDEEAASRRQQIDEVGERFRPPGNVLEDLGAKDELKRSASSQRLGQRLVQCAQELDGS